MNLTRNGSTARSFAVLVDRVSGADAPGQFFATLSVLSGGRMMPVAGGVPLTVDGQVAGAAGISGDTSDNDEACAVHGAHAAGLIPWLE